MPDPEDKEESGGQDDVKGDNSGQPDQMEALQAQLDALKAESEAMTAKNAQLERQKSDAEKQAREAAAAEAKNVDDFKGLHASAEEENAKLRQQLDEMRQLREADMVKDAAGQIGADLADGANQAIIARFAGDRLKVVDGVVRAFDEVGGQIPDGVAGLKREFEQAEMFASVRKGNQSTGGGSAGSQQPGAQHQAAPRTMTERIRMKKENPEMFKRLQGAQ